MFLLQLMEIYSGKNSAISVVGFGFLPVPSSILYVGGPKGTQQLLSGSVAGVPATTELRSATGHQCHWSLVLKMGTTASAHTITMVGDLGSIPRTTALTSALPS